MQAGARKATKDEKRASAGSASATQSKFSKRGPSLRQIREMAWGMNEAGKVARSAQTRNRDLLRSLVALDIEERILDHVAVAVTPFENTAKAMTPAPSATCERCGYVFATPRKTARCNSTSACESRRAGR